MASQYDAISDTGRSMDFVGVVDLVLNKEEVINVLLRGRLARLL
jgi:hypothetical protein